MVTDFLVTILKSSMDRFIGLFLLAAKKYCIILKSSMDRFIAVSSKTKTVIFMVLKSSMDRFIGRLVFEYAMSNDF